MPYKGGVVTPRYSVAVMGRMLWDGRGKTGRGGSAVTYELTSRLAKYFDCEMIFETSDKEKVGKTVTVGAGFTKRFIQRTRRPWHLDNEFVRNFDLIHIWDREPVFTYRADSRLFVPHFHTLHSAVSMREWMGLASAFYVPGYDVVAVGSPRLAAAVAPFWRGRVAVIPFGVDTERFKPLDKEECRARFHIPSDCCVLGCLGRPAKLDFLLAHDTLRKIKKATGRRDVVLLIAGGSKPGAPVYVTDDVIYLGYLDRADVAFMLNSCDVFFNPVAGIQEGFGLTVVEAMACGLPVVTTAWNGYTDTVSNDVGFLARTCWNTGDVWINQRDLVSGCVTLVEDEELRAKMGGKARDRVEKKFKWDYCVKEHRRRYLRSIQKRPPERIPYEKAPEEIHIRTGGVNRVFSLEEAVRRMNDFRVDFQELYKNFVSDQKMQDGGWWRFMCKDNILNLPKYRAHMRDAITREEKRVVTVLPKLVNALKK